jgi:hypothetical protein
VWPFGLFGVFGTAPVSMDRAGERADAQVLYAA